MGSTPPKPPLKQLGELLQENQDPFVLKIYLSERRYSKRRLYSECCFGCCYGNVGTVMKTSEEYGLEKKHKAPLFSGKLKEIYEKLALFHGRQKSKKLDEKDGMFWATQTSENNREVEGTDGLSSVSSTTEFYSCTDSDGEEGSFSATKGPTISKSCVCKQNEVQSLNLSHPLWIRDEDASEFATGCAVAADLAGIYSAG